MYSGSGAVVRNDYGVITSEHNLFGGSGLTNAQAFLGFTPDITDVTTTVDGTHPAGLSEVMETTLNSDGYVIPQLADNGGLTQTIALVPGSPAIDAGAATCVPTDQRGVTRPQGPACDIGAFEVEATPVVGCSFHTEGYRWLACDGTTWVSTLDQLEAYTANYGLRAGKYRNLAISANLGDAGTDLDIHSPCSIVVGSPVTLTGRSVNLDGRKGVQMNWGSKVDANGQACILSQQGQTELKGHHTIDANDLTLKAKLRARIGPTSQVTAAGPLRIESLAYSKDGRAEIATMRPSLRNRYSCGVRTPLRSATGPCRRYRGCQHSVEQSAGSSTVLQYQSQVQAGGALNLKSGGSARIAGRVLVTTPDTLTMNAKNAARCTVAASASISYASKAGNCAGKLP